MKMQSMYRRNSHELPSLNLASMPDLIFTVLFFFMLVTHMRDDNLKVHYQVPAGTEVKKLTQKQTVVNVYIGDDQRIQVNGDVVPLASLAAAIQAERRKMAPENAEHLTVSLKADKHTPMGVIADVKRELQKSYALKINYSGQQYEQN